MNDGILLPSFSTLEEKFANLEKLQIIYKFFSFIEFLREMTATDFPTAPELFH